MTIRLLSRQEFIDKLLDRLNEEGELSEELFELLKLASQWN